MSTVWTAIEMYPESTTLLVAANESRLMSLIVEHIGRDEYEEFAASLKGDEATDVTYDDAPEDVLRVWAGDRHEWEVGYLIGGDWLVREMEVQA